MTDGEQATLPLELSAGAAGPHASEAFAALGNETRLAILLALWDRYDPYATDNAVRFAELFEQVDYDDPGSFSYHLQQLTGHFIRQRPDDGYELRVPGRRFIQTVIAGAGVRDTSLGPTEIDQPCPFCDGPTAIQYRDGLVLHRCSKCDGVAADADVRGFLSAVPFDPAGLTERTPDEIRAASRAAAWRQTQFMFEGLCPACSGPVRGRLDCCPDHDPDGICDRCGTKFAVLARFECRVCKNHNLSSPRAIAMFHPAVIAFYEDHGTSTRFRADEPESVRRVFELMADHRVEPIARDPPHAKVTVAHGTDELQLVFDETVRVRSLDR